LAVAPLNAYADRMMKKLCTHPNVGGALLLSLGCESFNRGRPVSTVVIHITVKEGKGIVPGAGWSKQLALQNDGAK